MNQFFWVVASLLLLSLMGGVIRVVRGPTTTDRMMTAQLFGTTGVAILILLAEAMALPALRDVALVVVVLATVTATALVRHLSRGMAPGAPE